MINFLILYAIVSVLMAKILADCERKHSVLWGLIWPVTALAVFVWPHWLRHK